VLLLTAVALVLAGTVGAFAVHMAPGSTPTAPHQLSAIADASTGRITIVHGAGPAIDVRAISLAISVDGTPLVHQPTVPFLGCKGFRGAPSGPFNPSSDPAWDAGERAALVVAGTNDPQLTPGAVVRIEVFRDGVRIAVAQTSAR